MKRIAGASMIVVGVAVAGFGCLPWIFVKLVRPARHHYYFLSEDAVLRLYVCLVIGVVLVGTGIWLVASIRRQTR